jgi:hypothetical protein
VLASLRRVLQVAREACSTPVPRIYSAESSPNAGFLSPFFPLRKTTTSHPQGPKSVSIRLVEVASMACFQENCAMPSLPIRRRGLSACVRRCCFSRTASLLPSSRYPPPRIQPDYLNEKKDNCA